MSTRHQAHSLPQIKNQKYDSVYIKKWLKAFGRNVPRPAPCGIDGVKGHNIKEIFSSGSLGLWPGASQIIGGKVLKDIFRNVEKEIL